MPVLQGIEDKYINGHKVDKETDRFFFNDETHTYYDKTDMSKCISVTQLIEHYTNEFDKEFWITYKALEAILDMETWLSLKKVLLSTKKVNPKLIKKLDIDEDAFNAKRAEIEAEWLRKNKESTDRGTKIHAEMENMLYSKTHFDFSRFGYKDLDGDYDCKPGRYKFELYDGVYPEMMLSWVSDDGVLKVVGQADLIFCQGDTINLGDFKTNKEIKMHSYFNKSTKKYQMMKYPLDTIEDASYGHYSVQLSIYAYMLECMYPEKKIGQLMIIHFDHDDKQHNIPVEYHRDEVIKLFDHYRREMIKKAQYDKLKPVIE